MGHGFLYSSSTFTYTRSTIRWPPAWHLSSRHQQRGPDRRGYYYDSSCGARLPLYSGGTYITLDDPLGTGGTYAYGINDVGQIVGDYTDSSGAHHGFLYSGGTYTTLDDPLGSTSP